MKSSISCFAVWTENFLPKENDVRKKKSISIINNSENPSFHVCYGFGVFIVSPNLQLWRECETTHQNSLTKLTNGHPQAPP